jgi:hypothetical protein
MVRRGAPALYELMRRPQGGQAVPKAAAPAAPRVGPRAGSGPSIPDSFEISLGRAILIGIGVVVAISIAYGIGLSRGGARPSSEIAAVGQAASLPSEAPPAASSPAVPPLRAEAGRASGAGAAVPAASDNTADPRIKGRWYFVVAHPSTQRANEMVEFCRRNGLEAFRVPDDNALLRKIIVLPGYRDPSEKSSPEIKSLQSRIREVGEKWKSAAKGNQDFSGAYAEKFR